MNERSRHHAVLEIAQQTGIPEAEVNRLLEAALQDLAAAAQVHDYLLLLASKHVRQYLREKRRSASDNLLH